MISSIKISNVLLALCLLAMPLVAESLMVTIAYDSAADTLSVKHAELLAGAPPAPSANGNLILAYEFSGKPYSVARFYMPLANPLNENDVYGGDVEYTAVIPWDSRAGAVSVYDLNNTRYATLSLAGLNAAGDAIGTPPKESTAYATGGSSVAKAIGAGTSAATASGTQNNADTSNKTPTGGASCLPFAILSIALLAVFIRR